MLYYTAPIDIDGTTGDSVVMVAQSNPIHIYKIGFTVDAATKITIKHDAEAYTGKYPFASYGSYYLPEENSPHFVVGKGETFVISQTGTANIGGTIWYLKG